LKYFLLPLFLVIILLSACSESGATSETQKSSPTTAQKAALETLPSIPVAEMQKLFDECDHVDYIFYESNFSMSMDNKSSIQQTLTHVSEQVPVLDKNCKSIGRVFYEIDGNTEIEAEIYFSNECQHLVFMRKNERIYANNLTPEGVAHFNNIFKQASEMNK